MYLAQDGAMKLDAAKNVAKAAAPPPQSPANAAASRASGDRPGALVSPTPQPLSSPSDEALPAVTAALDEVHAVRKEVLATFHAFTSIAPASGGEGDASEQWSGNGTAEVVPPHTVASNAASTIAELVRAEMGRVMDDEASCWHQRGFLPCVRVDGTRVSRPSPNVHGGFTKCANSCTVSAGAGAGAGSGAGASRSAACVAPSAPGRVAVYASALRIADLLLALGGITAGGRARLRHTAACGQVELAGADVLRGVRSARAVGGAAAGGSDAGPVQRRHHAELMVSSTAATVESGEGSDAANSATSLLGTVLQPSFGILGKYVQRIVSAAKPGAPSTTEAIARGSDASQLPWREQCIAGVASLTYLCDVWQAVQLAAGPSCSTCESCKAASTLLSHATSAMVRGVTWDALHTINTLVLPDLGTQQWQSFQPFFKNARVTHGIQLWMTTLRGELHDLGMTCGGFQAPAPAASYVGVAVFSALLSQTLQAIAAFYLGVHPSRARAQQYVC